MNGKLIRHANFTDKGELYNNVWSDKQVELNSEEKEIVKIWKTEFEIGQMLELRNV